MINAGEFDKITALTREAVSLMHGFELAHVGINSENTEQATETAKMFCLMFGLEFKEGNSSIFAGKLVEVMKTPFRGKNGHIGIAVNNINRAAAYMQGQGFKLDMDNAARDPKGNLKAVYFEQEIGGFAVHLVQKQ
jgi:2-dehydro-3-deoxyphosphogluconate aldolase/(4S)-4-hydroxy-2-oxoglutarate aldolase